MTEEEFEEVEQQIGYVFKNRLLLQQAFTRRSYTAETHDGENNEVLEFIGDKVLDFVIVKILSEHYGKINDYDEYECVHSEGKLTALKQHLVESKMLAERIDEMGFAYYLIMSKGDRKNNVQNAIHVQEDLFEAILGAVALDSEWDLNAMQDAVEMMLHIDCYLDNGFDKNNDYVSKIQSWKQKQTGELPDYSFMDKDKYRDHVSIYNWFGQKYRKLLERGEGNIVCELRIDDGEPFVGFGHSKSSARMEAASLAYEYLEENNLLCTVNYEIGEPSLERAVGQLHELAQKGYFSYPDYKFQEDHDADGNP
ncbi:MAG: hypothetical protein K2G31_00260, partial [Clostridia bacterium]|nr:hypothetical protein [Clostridia bacterium]